MNYEREPILTAGSNGGKIPPSMQGEYHQNGQARRSRLGLFRNEY